MRHILTLNSGSSSLKFGLFAVEGDHADVFVQGSAQFGNGPVRLHAHDVQGSTLAFDSAAIAHQGEAIACVASLLHQHGVPTPTVIAHRVVHGGSPRRRHCVIDDGLLRDLRACVDLAPLHIPAALSLIEHAMAAFPAAVPVACFDTAFHADLPTIARTLPVSRDLRRAGVERYGFHGLSCESIVHQLGADLPDRLVIAHLGNGSSVTAVKQGVSIDTTMGMTPNGGVIMGTRTGDLDPGILVYLARTRGFDASALEDLVDHHSGLLGISGTSSDMRRLHELAPTDADAQLAIDMFCHSVRKHVAAMAASLGGIDMLVFTGGIGEHDARVRGDICAGLSWLGVAPSEASSASSTCVVRVLPCQENAQMARHAGRLTVSSRESSPGR